jgi:hypothetical protein
MKYKICKKTTYLDNKSIATTWRIKYKVGLFWKWVKHYAPDHMFVEDYSMHITDFNSENHAKYYVKNNLIPELKKIKHKTVMTCGKAISI